MNERREIQGGLCGRTHPFVMNVGCELPRGHPGDHCAYVHDLHKEVEWKDRRKEDPGPAEVME